jgi:hypothetical protein
LKTLARFFLKTLLQHMQYDVPTWNPNLLGFDANGF